MGAIKAIYTALICEEPLTPVQQRFVDSLTAEERAELMVEVEASRAALEAACADGGPDGTAPAGGDA